MTLERSVQNWKLPGPREGRDKQTTATVRFLFEFLITINML